MYLINSSGPIAATGTLFTFNVAMEDGITLFVDDNGGGSTITIETSPDNSAWTAFAGGFNVTSGAMTLIGGSTITAKGKFLFPLIGVNYIRFRVSTYVSGYVSARAEPSTFAPDRQPRVPYDGSKSAAGTTAADATPIFAEWNRVNAVSAGVGVKLPWGRYVGDVITIQNTNGTNALNVYPPDGGLLNGGTAALSAGASIRRTYVWDGTGWNSFA